MNYKIINAVTGAIVVGAKPFNRRDKVTEDLVKDPTQLANTLTRMSNITTELSQNVQKGESVIFQDCEAPEDGDEIRLQHNLGRRVMWRVVDWTTSLSSAPALSRNTKETTENLLVLNSYILGTISIEVF